MRARLTLRHSAASITGEFVRGPRSLARRTSSWWTKNSVEVGQAPHPTDAEETSWRSRSDLATSQGKSSRASAVLRRSAKRLQRTGEDEPWCREVVMLAQHQVRSEIARRPRVEQGRRVGTEFVEQVGELFSLDGVEGALAMSPEYPTINYSYLMRVSLALVNRCPTRLSPGSAVLVIALAMQRWQPSGCPHDVLHRLGVVCGHDAVLGLRSDQVSRSHANALCNEGANSQMPCGTGVVENRRVQARDSPHRRKKTGEYSPDNLPHGEFSDQRFRR